jgi:hypothetical protein
MKKKKTTLVEQKYFIIQNNQTNYWASKEGNEMDEGKKEIIIAFLKDVVSVKSNKIPVRFVTITLEGQEGKRRKYYGK